LLRPSVACGESVGSPLIVHVVFRFAVGGLENGVVNLINRLPAGSWRHAVVSLTEIDATFATRITRQDLDYVALHKGLGHALPLYPKLYRLFRKLRPAIVHTRNLAALEATLPAWAARAPVRIHGEHGRDMNDLDGSNVRYQRVRRMFSPFVTRYVALSPDLARYLCGKVGIRAERIAQIYNGVDVQRFCPSPNGRVSIEGCPFRDPHHWLVGTVGRMEAVKDQTNLARAFVTALRAQPAARQRMRLVLVGDGALRSPAEAILQQAGMRELAWLPGERADVPQVLQGLDCFVLPSLAEGVSNTILEAMACGLPVVATRVGANEDLIEDGATGHLVPPADSEALARGIVAYFSDPAAAKRHGDAGRQRVLRKFSLEHMVEQYHDLYTRLLDRPAASGSAAGVQSPGGRSSS
jgi:sugar transferase (PEP-CTERM/EpsH1 system associated)